MERGRQIVDHLWMIRQDTISLDVTTYYCGRIMMIEREEKILPLDELLKRLIKNRSEKTNE